MSCTSTSDDDERSTQTSGTAAPLKEPPPEVEPTQIQAESKTAQPGDTIELTFPTAVSRGGGFTLHEWVDDSWSETTYFMYSDQGGQPPRTVEIAGVPEGEALELEDFGVEGSGPDQVVLPLTITDGPWRICIWNTADLCTQLTISS